MTILIICKLISLCESEICVDGFRGKDLHVIHKHHISAITFCDKLILCECVSLEKPILCTKKTQKKKKFDKILLLNWIQELVAYFYFEVATGVLKYSGFPSGGRDSPSRSLHSTSKLFFGKISSKRSYILLSGHFVPHPGISMAGIFTCVEFL